MLLCLVAYTSAYEYYTRAAYINTSAYSSVYMIFMASGEQTKVTVARPGSKSLRTTIPAGIVSHFSINKGDTVHWTIEPNNGILRIVVLPERESVPKSRRPSLVKRAVE